MGTYFLLLHDTIDLKFSSLIQRVFLMKLEYSDLIYNLYLFSLLILKFSHFDPILVFPTPSTQSSIHTSHMKDVTISEEVHKYPRTECIYLCPNAYYCHISGQQTQIESGTRIPVDPKPESKLRENGHWVPEI